MGREELQSMQDGLEIKKGFVLRGAPDIGKAFSPRLSDHPRPMRDSNLLLPANRRNISPRCCHGCPYRTLIGEPAILFPPSRCTGWRM